MPGAALLLEVPKLKRESQDWPCPSVDNAGLLGARSAHPGDWQHRYQGPGFHFSSFLSKIEMTFANRGA